MTIQLSRRNFLAALGLGAASTTLAPRIASAQTAGRPPTRLILVFTSSGTIKDNWRPAGTGNSFALGSTLSPILAPLMPFKDKMLVVDGLDMRTAARSPGGPHPISMGGLFTGHQLQDGSFGSGSGLRSGWANGPSVDHVVAGTRSEGVPFRSLEFGVQCGRASNFARISFRAPGEPNPPMENPYTAFNRLFGAIGGTAAEQAALRARRRSVLDFVRSDLNSLGTALGGDDRHRLQAHVTGIRQIEQRLALSAMMGPTCEAPTLGAIMDPQAGANYAHIGQLQMDLIVSALACGTTRVASLQWSRAVSPTVFPWLGIRDSHHSLSHHPDGDADARGKLTQINRWYAQQLAYLCRQLDAIPEQGGGTLLDNTLIVWGNELSKGNNHSHDDLPFVLLGGAGGGLRMGRYARFEGRAHNDLLLTICRSMGMSDTSFGDRSFSDGALASLLS